MANPTAPTAESLRIRPEDVKARLDAGESVTILDVRSPQAWQSSASLAQQLRAQGYSRAYALRGGFDAWKKVGGVERK